MANKKTKSAAKPSAKKTAAVKKVLSTTPTYKKGGGMKAKNC